MFDSFLAEAISIREAMSWIKELGMHSVVVESDSLTVVNAIKHEKSDGSVFGMIIVDCLKLINDIPLCKVSFVKR